MLHDTKDDENKIQVGYNLGLKLKKMSDDIGFRHDLYVKKKRKIGEYEFWITQSLVSPIFHTIHFRTEIKNNIYIKQYEINKLKSFINT